MKSIHDIPAKFPQHFPAEFDNRIQHWGFFTREEIAGNAGKLLMLDFDFGGYCSLKCSDCYRRHNVIDEVLPGDLTYVEQMAVIDEAIRLGLRSVKICGKGEPTESTRFLQFVRDLSARGIGLRGFHCWTSAGR